MSIEAAVEGAPLTRGERSELRREVLRQAWPVVLQNLLHTLMFYVDTYMVSRLGSSAMAAMGVVGPVAHTITSVLSALSVGTIAIVARAWGEGDRKKQERDAASSVAVGLVLGLPLSVVGFFLLPEIARLFPVPDAPAVLGMARGFLRYEGASLVFFCVYVAATGVLRAAGRTTFAMMATLAANALNVLLNWIFIYGNLGAPRMGVAGSALATACALAFECILVVGYLWSPRSPVPLSLAGFRAVTRESLAK